MKPVDIFKGSPLTTDARNAMNKTGKVCYAVNSEKVDTCALHITATKNISLFATNYKKATFDATNVLPTPSLLDEYIVQTYTPSDHDGTGSTQGSHFAIIAAEDNTVIDYCPTEQTTGIKTLRDTYNMYIQLTEEQREQFGYTITPEMEAAAAWKAGDTLHSPVLKAGQVWYVWTGQKDNTEGDLSGTWIKARDEKKIAVFQGCPHTNIPYQTKERDHIFSQAMPTKYWGNTFVLTASKNRHKDYVRILALNDETVVRINGDSVYTFDFSKNAKHYWEFTIGDQGSYAKSGSCIVTTSCACATHLFLASKKADDVSDGDPAMLWVNPIEQQIDQVTFATYSSKNGTTAHYVNVVTDQPDLMSLDGNLIASEFNAVATSSTYYYAQISLGSSATSHTLKCDGGNFIAHVYGFTSNESYGYSAGGATRALTQYITINGEVFTPDSKNTLCGEDTIKFACHPDYKYEKIVWNFGDGETYTVTYEDAQVDSIVPHYYAQSKTYDAYVLIYRESSNLCVGQNAVDSIPITVTIGHYQFTIGEPDIPCPEDGKEYIGTINYTNPGNVDLHGDNVTIEFDAVAKADGFKDSELVIKDTCFQIHIPDNADPEKTYGIHIVIDSECGGADTTLTFHVNFDNDILIQRYGYLLGLKSSFMEGRKLSDFQWYRHPDGSKVEGQNTANLNFYDLPEGYVKPGDAFYVSFIIDKGTPNEIHPKPSCPKAFDVDSKTPDFGNPEEMVITASYAWQGDRIFVNADWKGKTDIECYAQWIDASGNLYQNMKFNIPDGGCTIPVPAENGLYLLRVYTDGKNRSFKFIINH
jgi:hypothetical protein